MEDQTAFQWILQFVFRVLTYENEQAMLYAGSLIVQLFKKVRALSLFRLLRSHDTYADSVP